MNATCGCCYGPSYHGASKHCYVPPCLGADGIAVLCCGRFMQPQLCQMPCLDHDGHKHASSVLPDAVLPWCAVATYSLTALLGRGTYCTKVCTQTPYRAYATICSQVACYRYVRFSLRSSLLPSVLVPQRCLLLLPTLLSTRSFLLLPTLH